MSSCIQFLRWQVCLFPDRNSLFAKVNHRWTTYKNSKTYCQMDIRIWTQWSLYVTCHSLTGWPSKLLLLVQPVFLCRAFISYCLFSERSVAWNCIPSDQVIYQAIKCLSPPQPPQPLPLQPPPPLRPSTLPPQVLHAVFHFLFHLELVYLSTFTPYHLVKD